MAESECEVIILGGGDEIIDQFPQEGDLVVTRQKVFLLTDTYQISMPDMMGWTRKEVSGFWKASGLPVKMDGYGKVTSQNIPPGTLVNKQTAIEVVLQE